MSWDREDAIKNIKNETGELIKKAKELEYRDDKAFVRDVLCELEDAFIAIAGVGNPGKTEPPDGDVNPAYLTDFAEAVSQLNSVVDRTGCLIDRVISDPAKLLLDKVKVWITKTMMVIMPPITRFLKLQSWSFGVSAAGFATITFTFGA